MTPIEEMGGEREYTSRHPDRRDGEREDREYVQNLSQYASLSTVFIFFLLSLLSPSHSLYFPLSRPIFSLSSYFIYLFLAVISNPCNYAFTFPSIFKRVECHSFSLPMNFNLGSLVILEKMNLRFYIYLMLVIIVMIPTTHGHG